jgi:hypothetical protein
MGLHGLVRGTQDLDIFIAPDAENVERLKQALRDVFDDPAIDDISADDLLGDYPAVQYRPPDGTFHIAILTRLGEAFRFEQTRAPAPHVRRSDRERGDASHVVRDEEGHRPLQGQDRRGLAERSLQAGGTVVPVRKYRSIEDMPGPPTYQPGSAAGLKALLGVLDFVRRTNPRRHRPGVRRFRSLAELQQFEEDQHAEHIRALRLSRRASGTQA